MALFIGNFVFAAEQDDVLKFFSVAKKFLRVNKKLFQNHLEQDLTQF